MYLINRGENQETKTLASYDTIFIDRCYNYLFQEADYTVTDVLNDDCFEVFPFSINNPQSERDAYEKAARYYNSFVPDTETIPLF